MAGIGIKLRELHRQGGLLGQCGAYGLGAIAVAGPWLCAVLAVSFIQVLIFSESEGPRFTTLVTYAYATALVITGPVQLIASRHIADLLWQERVDCLGKSLGNYLACTIALEAFAAIVLGCLAGLEAPLIVACVCLYSLVAAVWLVLTYLNATLRLRSLAASFLVGYVLSVGGVWFAYAPGLESYARWTPSLAAFFSMPVSEAPAELWRTAACVTGFAAGQLVLLAALLWIAFTSFRADSTRPPPELSHTPSTFLSLVVGSACCQLALWVDKILVGYTSGVEVFPRFKVCLGYDRTFAVAYGSLAIVLMVFLVFVETRFDERFRALLEAANQGAPLSRLRVLHHDLILSARHGASLLILVQTVVGSLLVALLPIRFGPHNFIGVAVSLHGLFLILSVGLLYLEKPKHFCYYNLLLLLLVIGFTLATLSWGVRWHGLPIVLAVLITIVPAYASFSEALDDMLYDVFNRQS